MLKFEKLENILNKIIQNKKDELIKRSQLYEYIIFILRKMNLNDFNNNINIDFSYAIPAEKPDSSYKLKQFEGTYGIIASDGSDTPLKEDFIFPYYLINIAYVFIEYGKEHKFFADSYPEIYYDAKDIYFSKDGKLRTITSEAINSLMLLKESLILSEFISNKDYPKPTIGLIDGSLIQWGVREKSKVKQKEFINLYGNLFSKAKEKGIPIAGYISGSHSKDVLGAINYYLMKYYNKKLEEEISFVYDTDIFQRVIAPYERSALFYNNEEFLKFYPEKIYFYYLNNGIEVVRIEVPEYVVNNHNMFELLNSIILNQCKKGLGYPEILKEAHEQAVIRNNEEETLENILTTMLNKEGFKIYINQKIISKKIRSI